MEKKIINDTLLYFTKNGHRLFRQNTGLGWAGRVEKYSQPRSVLIQPQDAVIRNARPLQAGLCTGSSDLIGWITREVTPDMLKKQIAIFTAIEVKYGKTRTTVEQHRFINAVNNSGGIGKIIHSIDELGGIFGND